MSQIKKVIHAQIQALVAMSQVAGTLKHGTSIGAVRESYLTAFLSDLLPQGISATSGILCDCGGRTSRQLDLVLTLDSSLPVISMSEGISLIPYDSALLAIEIKSTLDKTALTQLENQNSSIAQLKVSNTIPEGERFIVPTMVVAMEDSDLSADRVANWISQNGNTAACCVIGKYLVRGNDPTPLQVLSLDKDVFNETLDFVAMLYLAIQELQNIRNFKPNWARFLS